MSETDLILEGRLFPPFSARECIQSLTPLPQGILRRTLGGTLVHVGTGGPPKFQSTIHCKDRAPPAFEGLGIGGRLKVGCIQSLTQIVAEGTSQVRLEREAVTCHLYDSSGKTWPLERPTGQEITLLSDFPGGFVTYRPWLMMRVKTYHLETDEWGMAVGWTLELEEE
jgi:hypothetical protein